MEEQNNKNKPSDPQRKRPVHTDGAHTAHSADAVNKKKAAKRKKARKASIAVLCVLLAIIVAIIVLIAVVISMAKDLYNSSYLNTPTVQRPTGETIEDLNNLDGILTDEYGNHITLGPDETYDEEEPPYVTDNSGSSGTVDVDDEKIMHPDYPLYKVEQKDPNVLNIVIVGRDVGSTYGRADSSMLVSYNKKKNTVKIYSLMRDVYVPIKDHDKNKLGHSLSYGGMGLYINTVNQVYDLDVQKFALINFDGVEDVIDKLGGVEVPMTATEVKHYRARYGWKLKEGMNTLDGEQALLHCRNRSLAGADFERTRRQRDVLQGVYKKILAMGIDDGLDMIEMAMKYIRTNIEFKECMSIATDIFKAGGLAEMETDQIPFDGCWKYGSAKPAGYKNPMSVTIVDFDKTKKLLHEKLYVY